MTSSLVVGAEAEQDISHAYSWYEQQRAGLGREFITCVDDALASIQLNRLAYVKSYKSARLALVRKFPFIICFLFETDVVDVIAVFHGHRNPRRWKSRLR